MKNSREHELSMQVHHASHRPPPSDEKLRGAALIIVLAFLVIITGLVVAFLSSITNDAASTSAAASAITTRSLADAAIQLDIAQIRDATAGFARNADGSLDTNSPVCWASQPGAIRTWGVGSGGGGGGLSSVPVGSIYKLYSATKIIDTNNPSSDLPTNSLWISNNPALYTDLNAPVITVRSGVTNTNYPIMDPFMTNLTTGVSGSGGGLSLGSGQPIVDGFSINTNAPAISGVSNSAAMPVVWLYMLKDGTIIAPDAGSTTNATFSSAAKQPTSNNPIVGRIAFWTDDETCKLNINTASEGSYWATPSFSTSQDVAFGLFPPYAGEYNRYPGHPASTSLSPVLWSFFGLTNPSVFVSGLPGVAGPSGNSYYSTSYGTMAPGDTTTNVQTYLSNVLALVSPRYAWGGSFAGRKSPYTNLLGSSMLGSKMTNSTSRLYASVDEMFFAATNPAGPTNGRSIASYLNSTNSGGGGGGLSLGSSTTNTLPQQISALRFFLTTQSRAPEVNPLNLPKITMWPVPSTNNTMTANTNSKSASATRTLTDQTIAFCSTLGTNPYYFTRYNAASTTADYAGRNVTLYQFLTSQLNTPIPGFNGGGFISSGKWSSAQGSQIATEIYDYIRSCINLCDSTGITNFTSTTSSNYAYSYTVPPSANQSLAVGSGQVLPITIGNSRGLGRYPTMRGAALWFIARAANQPPLMVNPNGRPIVYDADGVTVLSDANGLLSQSTLTNLICSTNYTVYARVNPMHPWTTPPSSGGTTNTWLGNTISNVTSGGINYTLIPIMRYKSGTTNCPVFAVTNTNASSATKVTNNPSIVNQFFPVFDLTQSNAIVDQNTAIPRWAPCRIYPCIDTARPTNSSILSYNASGICFTYPDTNYPSSFVWTNSAGTNTNSFWQATVVSWLPNTIGTYGSIITNVNGSIQTHPGLPYLGLQVSSGSTAGQFSSNNPYFKDTPLPTYGQTRMEMAYVPDLVNVAPGQMALFPDMQLRVPNLSTLNVGGASLKFISNNPLISWSANLLISSNYIPTYDLGVTFYKNATTNTMIATNIVVSTNTFSFNSGAALQNQLYGSATNTANLVQTVNISFPSATFPTPKLYNFGAHGSIYPPLHANTWLNSGGSSMGNLYWGAPTGDMTSYACLTFQSTSSDPLYTYLKNGAPYWTRMNMYKVNEGYYFQPEMTVNGSANVYTTLTNDPAYRWWSNGLDRITCDTIQSVDLIYSDPRITAGLSSVPTNCFTTNPLYGNSTPINVNGWMTYLRAAHSLRSFTEPLNGGIFGTFLCAGTNGSTGTNSYFYFTLGMQGAISGYTGKTNIYSWTTSRMSGTAGWYQSAGLSIIDGTDTTLRIRLPYAGADCDFGNPGFFSLWQRGGDFDNGVGNYPDGPFINKADEGLGNNYNNGTNAWNPYFGVFGISGSSLFSANRMVPSPVMFGSLPVLDRNWDPANPSATLTSSSWRTLQFSPNPNAVDTNALLARNAAAGYNAAGSLITNSVLPDHLLLDFFQMPVVEPYPISDPFSTAGKVNMNYQIAPFNYINRDTAMRGVLKSLIVTAVDDQWGADYKCCQYYGNPRYSEYYNDSSIQTNPSGVKNAQDYNTFGSNSSQFYFQYPVHATETLRQFTNRFGQNDLFHSPSEICSLWLYPAKQPTSANPTNNTVALTNWDAASANIMNWWYGSPGVTRKSLTGDNIRERPYAYLYPRLTTKSNTYQIHYRVQTLKQTPTAHASDWSKWIDPAAGGLTDKVLGEQRGSAVIERFIDPGDPNLPDFASSVSSGGGGLSLSSSTNIMDTYYRFRILNAKTFTP